METFLNIKKISISVFILLVIVSCYFVVKTVNEVRNGGSALLNSQSVNTITVSGKGEALAISDVASLYINLNKEGKTSKEAQDLLNVEISKVLKYLKDKKIDDKDIKSEYGGLNPKYSYEGSGVVCMAYPCPTRDPKIVGYTATESITVKIRVVDSASDIRTGLAGIGVTDISGPTFSIDDEESFKVEARSKAILDAKEKAKVLADELGVRLGHVVSFNENNGGGYPMYGAKAMMADSVSSVAPAPVLPKGENKITSNVSITYEIK